MIRPMCCLLLLYLVILPAPPAAAQKPGMKFAPINKSAQIDRVFDTENFKTVKGQVGGVLPDRKIVLQIEGAAPAVAADTMRQLPREIQGLPLDFTLQRGEDNTVLVTSVKPSLVTAWEASPVAKGQLSELDAAVRRLDDTLQKSIESPTMGRQGMAEIAASASEVHEAFLTSYAATPASDTEQLNRLALLRPKIMDFKKKALIGFDDNYRPEVYQRMFDHSRSVVGIALRGGEKPVGSGTLIGKNLILTCSHVFEEDVRDYEVWFDFEETSTGLLTKRTYPIKELVYEGQSVTALRNLALDFVLVEIGADEMNRTSQQQGYKPMPITKVPCRLDDPVYVMGHPSGSPRTVHDNARVVFPYFQRAERKADLDSKVREEILNFVKGEYSDEADRQRVLEDLLADYQSSFVAAGGGFKYVSDIRGPAIGIDSDTFSGDSGGPLCMRRGAGKSAGIVGVFVGGSTTGAQRAGWLIHEVALPIVEILDQLDADPRMAGWATKYGVTVQNP